MAESGNSGGSDGGSWWGGWLAAAKQQTERALEMVSADLQEFTATMQSDTKKVVEKTKESMQKNTPQEGEKSQTAGERVKKGFFSLMDGITKALTVDPEVTSPPSRTMQQPAHGIFDRAKIRLRAVQVDTGTYLNEPAGSPHLYADWLKSFDIEAHKGEISDLLVSMVEVRSLYTSLVPSEVSHQEFWRRYFYRVHQLKLDEARKQALMKRAEQAQVKEDSISWDEEVWSGDEESPGDTRKETRVKTEDPSTRLQRQTDTGDDSVKLKEETTEKNRPASDQDSKSISAFSSEAVEQKDGPKLKNTGEDSCENSAAAKTPSEDTVDVVESEKVEDKANTEEKPAVVKSDLDETQGGKIDTIVSDKSVLDKSAAAVEENLSANVVPAIKQDVKKDKKEAEKDSAEICSTTAQEVVDNKQTECDSKMETEKTVEVSGELQTKVKEDIVVVGDRISPTSDSSGTKESSTEDWEKDFNDMDITAEDLKAAQELASKLNMSAAEYNTLTGGEEDEDWENWE